jgi:hypothetical protein
MCKLLLAAGADVNNGVHEDVSTYAYTVRIIALGGYTICSGILFNYLFVFSFFAVNRNIYSDGSTSPLSHRCSGWSL